MKKNKTKQKVEMKLKQFIVCGDVDTDGQKDNTPGGGRREQGERRRGYPACASPPGGAPHSD